MLYLFPPRPTPAGNEQPNKPGSGTATASTVTGTFLSLCNGLFNSKLLYFTQGVWTL